MYLAGSENGGARIWKNGTAQNLSNGGIATSVTLSGSDVYVSGSSGRVAIVWKNGTAQNLTDGAREAHANSVLIK